MKKLTLLSTLIGAAGILGAQETPRFTFAAGAGFTTPVGHTSRATDVGWNVSGGAGVNIAPHVGLMLDASYNSLGVNSDRLGSLGYGGGNVNVFSVTLNPVVHVLPKGPVDLYLTGGGGYYRQSLTFTQPGVQNGIGFDPFFGFYPYSAGVNIVVSEYSVNKPGVDAGAGLAFGSKWGGKFFAEARYHRIFLGNRHTDFVPVTFGFRR